MLIHLPVSFPGIDRQFRKLESLIMSIQEQLQAKVDELNNAIAEQGDRVTAVVKTETAQILVAFEDLRAAYEAGQNIDSQLAVMDAAIARIRGDELVSAIAAIYEPPAPPVEPPAPVDDDLA